MYRLTVQLFCLITSLPRPLQVTENLLQQRTEMPHNSLFISDD